MNIQLVGEWKQFYKMYSIWAMAFLGALPDIYNVCLAAGFFEGTDIPAFYARFTNIAAVVGIVVRLIKQQKMSIETPAVDAPGV